MANKQEILDSIADMTVLELSELLKEFETRFDVTAAAPAAVAVAAPSDAEVVEEEEQTSFNVMLTAVGDKKVQVIKAVRSLTSLGLKEAKAVVDEAPKAVLEGVDKAEAEKAKAAIEAVGATVEIT